MEQIQCCRRKTRCRTERIAQPGVNAKSRQGERNRHYQFQRMIEPETGRLGSSCQPVKAGAIMMKGRFSESGISTRKPTWPVDSLLERSIHGSATVNMRSCVVSAPWKPVQLPEWTGEKQGHQNDEENRAQANPKTIIDIGKASFLICTCTPKSRFYRDIVKVSAVACAAGGRNGDDLGISTCWPVWSARLGSRSCVAPLRQAERAASLHLS